MDEILNYSMNEMAKASFDCSCGRHHTLDIDKLVMGQGVIKELPEMVKGLGAKKVYMLSDNNTYKAAGETAETLLKDAGFSYCQASKEDIKRLYAVYFVQNITQVYFDDYDGERFVKEDEYR